MVKYRIGIGTTIEARLARTGGMYYVRIPKRTVEFYGLELGDLLKIEIIEAKEAEKR